VQGVYIYCARRVKNEAQPPQRARRRVSLFSARATSAFSAHFAPRVGSFGQRGLARLARHPPWTALCWNRFRGQKI
jgi:hypothetical protein